MRALVLTIGFAILLPLVVTAQEERPTVVGSFSTAKKKALSDVYKGRRTTFYCDCKFNDDKSLDPAACGYEPRNPLTLAGNENVRTKRIEWEHVVPASRFGRMRSCWQNTESFPECKKNDGKFLNSRKCCAKVDDEFAAMEADLMNLRPAVGELNADRSDNPYNLVDGEPRQYGSCDFEVQGGVAEPETRDRGEIGRTYLYMERVWGMTLTQAERERFTEWHKGDPPNSWEKKRNDRVKALQGIGNPFVENADEAPTGPCIPRSQCCRVCGQSQACGDACISTTRTCRKDPGDGCACNAADVCE